MINRVFIDVVNDIMVNNGFGRIGSTYYKWMKDEQIVLSFSYEMLFGNRCFRLRSTAHSYVDGIALLPGKQLRLWLDDYDMILYDTLLCRQHGHTIINENNGNKYDDYTFKKDLEDNISFYNNYFFPKFFSIDSLETLFSLKNTVRIKVYGEEVWASTSLLYESLKLHKYEYAQMAIKYYKGLDNVSGSEFSRDLHFLSTLIDNHKYEIIDNVLEETIQKSASVYESYFSRHKIIS